MKPNYVLIWRTPSMPAPAFWYYTSEAVARRMADSMRDDVVWLLKPIGLYVRVTAL